MVCPGVQLKPIESDALNSYRNLHQIRPYFAVEAVGIHTQIARGIAQPVEPPQHQSGQVMYTRNSCTIGFSFDFSFDATVSAAHAA